MWGAILSFCWLRKRLPWLHGWSICFPSLAAERQTIHRGVSFYILRTRSHPGICEREETEEFRLRDSQLRLLLNDRQKEDCH